MSQLLFLIRSTPQGLIASGSAKLVRAGVADDDGASGEGIQGDVGIGVCLVREGFGPSGGHQWYLSRLANDGKISVNYWYYWLQWVLRIGKGEVQIHDGWKLMEADLVVPGFQISTFCYFPVSFISPFPQRDVDPFKLLTACQPDRSHRFSH